MEGNIKMEPTKYGMKSSTELKWLRIRSNGAFVGTMINVQVPEKQRISCQFFP
jgi:hypothetical protein